jgi:hypothetical protein
LVASRSAWSSPCLVGGADACVPFNPRVVDHVIRLDFFVELFLIEPALENPSGLLIRIPMWICVGVMVCDRGLTFGLALELIQFSIFCSWFIATVGGRIILGFGLQLR